MNDLTAHLHTLPTETLKSLAALTGTLRAKQHLRALDDNTLTEMRWRARMGNGSAVVLALVTAELAQRGKS